MKTIRISHARVAHQIWVLVFAIILCQVGLLEAEEKEGGGKPAAFKVTGSGRPMILIPRLGCGGNVWDGTVAHFKGRYECHVVTLAGFAGQPGIGEPFLEQVRDGLVEYIRQKKLERPVVSVVERGRSPSAATWAKNRGPNTQNPSFKKPCFLKHYISIYAYTNILSDATTAQPANFKICG